MPINQLTQLLQSIADKKGAARNGSLQGKDTEGNEQQDMAVNLGLVDRDEVKQEQYSYNSISTSDHNVERSQVSQSDGQDDCFDIEITKYKRWTNDENDKFRQAFTLYGKNFKKISEYIETKSFGRVKDKYGQLYPKGIRKSHKWTAEEDEKLLKYKEMYPNASWLEMSRTFLPGLLPNWIEFRFYNLIGIPSSFGRLTDLEALKACILQEKGLSINEISRNFQNRPFTRIKKCLIRHLKPYLSKYRLSYLEQLADPSKPIMECPIEINLSKESLKYISFKNVSKDDLFQFIPMLRRDLEIKLKVTTDQVLAMSFRSLRRNTQDNKNDMKDQEEETEESKREKFIKKIFGMNKEQFCQKFEQLKGEMFLNRNLKWFK